MANNLLKLRKNLISLNDALITFALDLIPEEVLYRISYLKAKRLAKKTIKTVPAYQDFLKKSKFSKKDFKRIDDLPVMTKDNYIKRYNLAELTQAPMTQMYSLESSSGFSGKSYYWPRFKTQDKSFRRYTEQGFINVFNIHRKSTLFINCFILGSWVSGEKLSRILKQISAKSQYDMTVLSIGLNLSESVHCILDLAKYYEQIIIAGYPPFLKRVFEGLSEYTFKGMEFSVISGGEGFPEEWREHIFNLIKKTEAKPGHILSAYGSADTSLGIAYETDLSVRVRKIFKERPSILKKVIGKHDKNLPSILQYNPLNYYLESINGKLVYTINNGIPLIRYDIKDHGYIISFSKMKGLLEESGFEINTLVTKHLKLPFIILFGREDGSISINGANIHIDLISEVLNHTDIAHVHTGKYTLKKDTSNELGTRMIVEIEMKKNHQINLDEFIEMITKKIVDNLNKKDYFYSTHYKQNPDIMTPIIKLVEEDDQNSNTSIKNKYL